MDNQLDSSSEKSKGNEGENAPSFIQELLFNVIGLVSVLVLALILLLTWQGIQSTKNKHRNDVHQALDRATERLRILLRAAEMTAESAERAARATSLTSHNLRTVIEQSLSAFEQRPELSYLGIVLPNTGEYINLERRANGDILLWSLPGKRVDDPMTRNFLLTDDGFVLNEEALSDGYDARKRPFYQAALTAPAKGIWMSAYQWIVHFDTGNSPPLWGISYMKPLRSSDGQLLGVLDADLDLPALNRFLYSLEAEYKSKFQIIELGEIPKKIAGSGVNREPISLPESINSIINFEGKLYEKWSIENGQQQWVVSNRLSLPGGITWLIVASLDADFIEKPLRNYLYIIVLIAVLIGISLVFILKRIARRFGMPLAELEQRVLDLLQYDELLPDKAKKSSIVDSFRETHLLGRAVDRMAIVVKDVLDTKERESASLALKGAIFDSSTTAILSLDEYLNVLECNNACVRLFGLPREEIINRDIQTIVIAAKDNLNWPELLNKIGNAFYTLNGEHGPFDAEVRIAKFKRQNRQIFTIFINDISERKQVEEQFRYLASHDGLTGLPNRYLIRDRIEQAITHARRSQRYIAVLYLDLDRFKVINDGYGHNFGDAALVQIAERLCGLVRESDTVSRQGGDEFLILLTELQQPEEAYRVAENICRALDTSLNVENRKVYISGSAGISVFPTDGDTADLLIENADMAMYKAKDAGRNTVQYFTHKMSEETLLNIELENRLRTAIETNQLHLVYQPKYSTNTGEIKGCEALVRWQDPEHGAISPLTFIPIAEDSGLIEALGQWVLAEACLQAKNWFDKEIFPFRVSVNVSASQFLRQNLVKLTFKTLEETGLSPNNLELELTESLLAHDVKKVTEIVGQLRAAGIKLSIDDFGTGYSSLSYLKRFPIDTLKIDQSFVRDMLTDSEDAAIVIAVIALAHNLGFEVLAEGVETKEQYDILCEHYCDDVQGYYFSKPISASDFEAMLSNKNSE